MTPAMQRVVEMAKTCHFSRFGFYESEESAMTAGDFLFGPNNWLVRYSEHGWFYVDQVAPHE